MLLASGFHTIIMDALNERATQFKVELAAGRGIAAIDRGSPSGTMG
jgi:hypothetical protein